MGVGLKLGEALEEVGTSDFFRSFFFTISRHLEPKGWGSRFPELMNHLYAGKLDSARAVGALSELEIVRRELKDLPPDKVVWDIDNLMARPPWGSNISKDITDLSNYFVTSTGKDLLEVLRDRLEALRLHGGRLSIERM